MRWTEAHREQGDKEKAVTKSDDESIRPNQTAFTKHHPFQNSNTITFSAMYSSVSHQVMLLTKFVLDVVWPGHKGHQSSVVAHRRRSVHQPLDFPSGRQPAHAKAQWKTKDINREFATEIKKSLISFDTPHTVHTTLHNPSTTN